MSPIIIYIAVFCGVAALVGGIAFYMGANREAEVEERLKSITGAAKGRGKAEAAQYQELLNTMRNEGAGAAEQFISRYLNLRLLFEQANVSLTVPNFLLACCALSLASGVASLSTRNHRRMSSSGIRCRRASGILVPKSTATTRPS